MLFLFFAVTYITTNNFPSTNKGRTNNSTNKEYLRNSKSSTLSRATTKAPNSPLDSERGDSSTASDTSFTLEKEYHQIAGTCLGRSLTKLQLSPYSLSLTLASFRSEVTHEHSCNLHAAAFHRNAPGHLKYELLHYFSL